MHLRERSSPATVPVRAGQIPVEPMTANEQYDAPKMVPRNGQYTIHSGRVRTRSLEVHIVDHCHLKCWGCCSLSPYLPKWYIDPADLERDLRVARRALAPEFFKLVGGEPLLHPGLDDCLEIARSVEIAPVVSVTTTGFLLPRCSERFWGLVQGLTISLYPDPILPAETISLIEARAAEHAIALNWKRQDRFVDMDVDARREDAKLTQATYDGCWLRQRCHVLSQGRFFTCTRPPHFETFYGSPEFLKDGILLEEREDMAESLLAYLQQSEPLRACAYCQGGDSVTRPHRQMSHREIAANLALRR